MPTNFYNLDNSDYYVDGNFGTRIYTEYYFHPNADGELYYNLSFEWESSRGVQGYAEVECWDKTTGKRATTTSFLMPDNNDGTYGPIINTGTWKVWNLDPTHNYYFRFVKTDDDVSANVTGTIHT